MNSSSIYQYQEPRRLHGIPGVVYVLANTALKNNIVRIGLSRRSGWAKAAELNRDKTNNIPGSFECIFEIRAQDGGAAIEAILKEIHHFQFGKKEQNFFSIHIDELEEILTRIVTITNQHVLNKYQEVNKLRDFLTNENNENNAHLNEQEVRIDNKDDNNNNSPDKIQNEMNRHLREGIFDRANVWVNKILN